MSQFAARFAIPLGVVFMTAQASLVSVYGGQRAIIFDRFSGVKSQVSEKARQSESILMLSLTIFFTSLFSHWEKVCTL
jgi:hypothetical protein